jgi:carbon starvation protein
MPAFTKFIDGTGPVWSGSLFPFLFITIACGAVSGFHALISSGTTPKLLDNEKHARMIGYGGMLMESFVAMMALVAASVIEPGVYFAMNSPAAVIGKTAESAALAISQWGFVVTPEMLLQTAQDVGEKTIISRAGGAPTLAVGMAHILSSALGGKAMMAFWYHFAILFEALFILTAVDAGTRAGRFMLQDLLGTFVPSMRKMDSIFASLVATGLCVAAWGYFLYQGVVDPLGGINTLWPLFGIANQMLAGVALTLATVVLFKMKRQRFAWVTVVPTIWLLLHPHRRLAEGLPRQPEDRLPGQRQQVPGRRRQGRAAGPGQIHGADAPDHHQQLRGRGPLGALHPAGAEHPGLRHPGLPARALQQQADHARDPFEPMPASR